MKQLYYDYCNRSMGDVQNDPQAEVNDHIGQKSKDKCWHMHIIHNMY